MPMLIGSPVVGFNYEIIDGICLKPDQELYNVKKVQRCKDLAGGIEKM